jgi:radical SAM protein with 4Fe4S-binding SPASM domain
MIRQMKDLFSGCATGLHYCGLDPSGELLPCAPASEIRLGNIFDTTLEDAWIHHPVLNTIS